MIPFAGFFPDADEHTEGVITDCEMLLPTFKGYKGAPALVSKASALAAACRGAVYVVKLDSTTRLFAGTQTKLYELSGTSWTDVSRTNPPSSANDYTGSSESVWRFTQFGNVSLAVNGVDATQYSVSSGDFNDLAGAPKGKCMDAVGGFVFIANYNDGTETPDGVFWCAYQDYTDWTPDIATQCGNVRLLDTPGDIRGVKRLGEYMVAYKENSLYLGVNSYTNTLWGFRLVSADIGAVSQEAVVSTETAHFFICPKGIYVYTAGGIPQPIDDGIRDWFLGDLNNQYAYKIRGVYDPLNSIIYWYYPSSASTTLDSCLVYNVKTRKWGRANRSIEVCLEYISGAMTYAAFESAYATYDAIPSIPYGSPFWTAASPNMAVISTDHVLSTLTGTSSSCSVTTGAIGDDMQFTLLKRVQPRFVNDADTGSLTNYYRTTDGSVYTTGQTVSMGSNRFDLLRSARWHKVKLVFTGDVEIIGNTYHLVPTGWE